MSDRMLTSHAGSLPRPDDLSRSTSGARRARRRRGGVRGQAARGGGRRGRAPARDRHRPGQRRRVRPLDGPALRLRLVVDLRLPAARRPRADAGRRSRRCRSRRPKPGEIGLATFAERRDWQAFAEAYGDPTSGAALPNARRQIAPVCRGPITYQGHEDVQRDIANIKAAMEAAGVEDGFLNSVAPGSCAPVRQRVLRQRRGDDVRLRRRDARGVQGDHRRGPDPAARRSGDRRELGPDQPGAERRGLPALHDGAGRGAQPRDPRPARRPHPLPPVLGKLARSAHHRHPDGATSSTSCSRSTRAPTRSRRPTCATSTSGRSGRT